MAGLLENRQAMQIQHFHNLNGYVWVSVMDLTLRNHPEEGSICVPISSSVHSAGH